MAKRNMAIQVRGKQFLWSFHFDGDQKNLDEWRADGLDIVEVCNTIPVWLPSSLIRLWCVVQDIFNFRSPL